MSDEKEKTETEETIESTTSEEGTEQQAKAPDDPIKELENKLAECEKQSAEHRDGWQRAQAAFANFRKRTEREQTQWRSTANAALLGRLLPVVDDFARAFDALPDDLADNSWLDGVRLIQRKIQSVLDSESVKVIELKPGDPFDPMYHQAVLDQEMEGFEAGQIIAEAQKGYILGDRVLRPSMVVVAKAPSTPAEAIEPEASADETAETA